MSEKTILEKIKEMDGSEPYLITLTTYNKEKGEQELDTHLYVNNFPYYEFEGTKKMIVKLMDKEVVGK